MAIAALAAAAAGSDAVCCNLRWQLTSRAPSDSERAAPPSTARNALAFGAVGSIAPAVSETVA
ncbi:MAG TPA: hypothetical protein VFQ80_15155 [Thermomicrobiales bacterium]|nr:hypothetical protein [Thermomicrobiales bacterium]